jgi:hypothetical protein
MVMPSHHKNVTNNEIQFTNAKPLRATIKLHINMTQINFGMIHICKNVRMKLSFVAITISLITTIALAAAPQSCPCGVGPRVPWHPFCCIKSAGESTVDVAKMDQAKREAPVESLPQRVQLCPCDGPARAWNSDCCK